MHNAGFRALGLDWSYELLDVPPDNLPAAVKRLREEDVAGANVTIPHKQAVMQQLDGLNPEALRTHAVNTIAREGARLIEGVGLEPRGAVAVVLGAGGSARAAAVALDGAHITFVSRHPEDSDLPGRVVAWADASVPKLVREADLLLNATPLGRREEMPLRPAALPRDGAVIDLVYVTGGTPLARKARSLGLRTVDGWEILLDQGARSFETWTGRRAPVDAMRDTLQP
jgi:shikimate dehydrogenase